MLVAIAIAITIDIGGRVYAITGMPGPHQGSCPILRMYGVNMEGNSVLAHIYTAFYHTSM